MLVSIIIPSYNSEKFLKTCLQSCYKQTHKDFEIILIDDYSSDNTFQVAKDFNIRYVRNDKNLGPAASRNIGIELSNGELISFIDADDIMNHNKLSLSIDNFNSDIGMTCGNYQILYDRVRLFGPFYANPIDITYDLMMKQNFVASGSTTVRKDVLDDVGVFNEDYWIAEDYDLWLRISEKYRINYIHDILYYYSITKNSDSLTQRTDIQLNHMSNLKKIREDSKARQSAKNKK